MWREIGMKGNTVSLFFIFAIPIEILLSAYLTLRFELVGTSDRKNYHEWALLFYWLTLISLIFYLSWIGYLVFRNKKKKVKQIAGPG
jgi:hypothetical protein